ncbi:MAG: DCC1-like thiol-disulfide oxidoreductase family protein [Pseudomonadota bacterium]
MRPKPTEPYSWRARSDVPAFEDTGILLVMDGECALCSGAARFIARLDTRDRVRIATAQSDLGRALFRHFAIEEGDPETWLMLEAGQAYGSIDAITRLFPRLHWGFMPVRVLRVLPLRLQDWIYARIARNRYAIFGRSDLCSVPDAALRAKLIS